MLPKKKQEQEGGTLENLKKEERKGLAFFFPTSIIIPAQIIRLLYESRFAPSEARVSRRVSGFMGLGYFEKDNRIGVGCSLKICLYEPKLPNLQSTFNLPN